MQDACLAADGRRVLVMDSHSVVGLLDAETGALRTNLVHHAQLRLGLLYGRLKLGEADVCRFAAVFIWFYDVL